MFNAILNRLANSSAGLFLRKTISLTYQEYDPKFNEIVSDLFMWRCDEEWETYFDLTHIAGLINPLERGEYRTIIILFSSLGVEISQHWITVSYAESQLLRINDLLSAQIGFGTFAVIHMAPLDRVFGTEQTCLVERGYVSYRRKSDSSPLRSYIHGNLYGISGNPDTNAFRVLTLPTRRKREYQPQVRLDDCNYCEVAIVNYSPKKLNVEIIVLNKGMDAQQMRLDIDTRGAAILDSSVIKMERIALLARMPMPRPILFKHYESHFDVFHG